MLPGPRLYASGLMWPYAESNSGYVFDFIGDFDLICPQENDEWWSWGDLNPRPQAFFEQFYMCSRLFWISPPEPRSGTLPRTPATLDLTVRQVARRTTSLCK